jgi:hypothetical protein
VRTERGGIRHVRVAFAVPRCGGKVIRFVNSNVQAAYHSVEALLLTLVGPAGSFVCVLCLFVPQTRAATN